MRHSVIGAISYFGGDLKADTALRFVAYWLCHADSLQLCPWQALTHLRVHVQEILFVRSPHRAHRCHHILRSPLPACCDRIANRAILSFPAATLL